MLSDFSNRLLGSIRKFLFLYNQEAYMSRSFVTKATHETFLLIILFSLVLFGLLPPLVAPQPVVHAAGRPNTIPALQQWTDGAGSYTFSAASRVMYNGAGLAADATTFADDLKTMTGFNITTVSGSSPATGDLY